MMSRQLRKLLIFGVLAGALMLACWAAYFLRLERGIDLLQAQNQQHLEQFVGHLESELGRYQFLPELIAKNELLVEVLNDPDNSARVDLVNRFLESANAITGASDTYLMDRNGNTLAASNWLSERPFVGRNFSFRPYFRQAMQGKLGRYFALGTTSGRRGYYFAYPVTYAANIIGVIVIKMDLSDIERRWSERSTQFIVTDEHGVIFITTQQDWLYKTTRALPEDRLDRIHLSRQYADQAIERIPVRYQPLANSRLMIRLLPTEGGQETQYLASEHAMPQVGWNVTILAPLKPIRRQSLGTATIVLLLGTLLILLLLLLRQRHRRRRERERFHLESQKQLEREVSIRTADLRNEIEEHKHTEMVLRNTQDELIQTAKLAVLGQMSASISHELNNPLAAIRSYADNAQQFLKLDKPNKASDNLQRIAELTERMGKISSQLKFFARKSSGALETVVIEYVIQSAIDITRPQHKQSSLRIMTDHIQRGLSVRADHIQLEQVLVNLINNAANALSDHPQGEIHIATEKQQERVLIHVRDNGPGIDPSNLERIFDPFFTTSKSGLGLGLSISARIIDSMNGQLSAQNLDSGGACFTIELIPAKAT